MEDRHALALAEDQRENGHQHQEPHAFQQGARTDERDNAAHAVLTEAQKVSDHLPGIKGERDHDALPKASDCQRAMRASVVAPY